MERKDLQYKYFWSAYGEDNPKVRGGLDSTLLNKNEGYEVLYFINKFMATHTSAKLTPVQFGKKIEEKIHQSPSEVRSQENVKEWILKNWNS